MRSARTVTVIGFLLIFLSFSFAGFVATAEEGMLNTTPGSLEENKTLLDLQKSASGSAQEVDYELPYPGILPNHPLFFLKQLRDSVLNFLIRDPEKRIEFNILMADKRLNMGVYLADESSYDDALVIVTQGEHYLDRALEDLEELSQNNPDQDISKSVDLISSAIKKHDLILIKLMEKSPEQLKQSWTELREQLVLKEAEITKISNE